MNAYILDASVVINALRADGKTIQNELRRLLRKSEKREVKLYSTSLLFFEVLNGLRFSYENSGIALGLYDNFLKLSIDIFPLSHQQEKEILKMSYQLKTTVYDTAYHFIALLLQGEFLTSDEEYYKKAKHIGSIRLLK